VRFVSRDDQTEVGGCFVATYRFASAYPHLQGTVTDLLIGDLFNDEVDTVWQPMESMYPAGEVELPSWSVDTPADTTEHRANDLELPEGRKPWRSSTWPE
jgi:hypothetical protein